MSGCWLESSATSATALTNSIASAKLSNRHSRTSSSRSRSHCERFSRDSISSSLSNSATLAPSKFHGPPCHARQTRKRGCAACEHVRMATLEDADLSLKLSKEEGLQRLTERQKRLTALRLQCGGQIG